MNQKLGKASVRPEQPVYILNSGSVVGTKILPSLVTPMVRPQGCLAWGLASCISRILLLLGLPTRLLKNHKLCKM